MGQERLNDLAIMSIEKKNLQGINPDNVIDRFAKLKQRRYSLVLPPQSEKRRKKQKGCTEEREENCGVGEESRYKE